MSKTLRGLRSDGEATRTRILEAAGEQFAAAGFAETTSKAIAARAGVDLASINYHFGSRSGLYEAVLVEAHRRFVDFADLQQLAQGTLRATDKLKVLINQLAQRAGNGADEWHLTVLATEALAPSSHVQVLFKSESPRKISLVIGILSEITAIPPRDPALLRCMLSVVAPCLLLLIGRRGLPEPMQDLRQTPHEVLVEHLHRFSIAGLEAIGREYALNRGSGSTRRRKASTC